VPKSGSGGSGEGVGVGMDRDGRGSVPVARGTVARGDEMDGKVDRGGWVGNAEGGGISAGTAVAGARVVGIPVGMCVTSCDMTNDNCCNCSEACATR
jgi:hypothetical protein